MTSSGLSRQLGLRSLTLAVVTSTIGSGWLFAPFYAARSAGFIGGWSAWIAYLALPTIEVLAVLAWINLAGVGWLARWIDGLTA